MVLTQEELDRKKFSGEGTGITRKPVPTVKGMLGAADRAIGRGVDALVSVPGKVMNAITPERRGYSGEVDPVAAVGGFMSRAARSAPNTFGGAEMAASAGQRPLQGFGFGSAARAEQPAPVAAQMDVPVLDDQSKVAAKENLTGTAAPPSTPANPVAQPQGFKSTLSNGLTMTGDMQGNRTYTMGTPGQDGYGMMTVRGGQNAMAAQNLAGSRPQQAQQPYPFEGSPEDRSRFMQQPTPPAMQDGNTSAFPGLNPAFVRIREQQEAEKAAKEQLAGLDPRSGWGWKGRRELYLAQQGLGQRASEEQTRAVMDAARLLSGQQQNQAQIAEQQRQFNEGAPLRQAETEAKQLEAGYTRMKNELAQRWQQATDPKEKEALYRQMLGMEGKEPRNNIETVDVPNPADPMGGTMKVPARINPDGTYTRLQEQGGQQDDPWARIQGNPARLNAFNALPPEKKAEFIQKLYQ